MIFVALVCNVIALSCGIVLLRRDRHDVLGWALVSVNIPILVLEFIAVVQHVSH